MKLSEIHTKYDTDKGTFHSYIDKYDELFSPYQYEYIKLLEIGCLTCASTKMFNEFFPNAYIIGVDNWQQDFDHEGESFKTKGVMVEQIKKDIVDNYPRVKLITCDSTNTEQVNSIFKGKTFNIILDDGDHTHEAQLNTFKNFVQYLELGGIYIIEDILASHIIPLHDDIKEYIELHNLNLTVEINGWYKNNRPDDSMIIVR